LGLSSEAGKRFYHGLTAKRLCQSLDAAIKMYEELGGKVTGMSIVGESVDQLKNIPLRLSKVAGLIGEKLTAEQVENYLKKLHFVLSEKVTENNQISWVVAVPYFRLDIELEEDLIEEIFKIDRWNDKTIYFSGNVDPQIKSVEREKISFTNNINKNLNIFSRINTFIFAFQLENGRISNSSEDALGVSFNSSLKFSQINIFQIEKYFDPKLDLNLNLNHLLNDGEYCVDYEKGIIYLFWSTEEKDFGSVNYLELKIKTQFPHILTVNDIYFSFNPNTKNKKINYTSFSDTEIFFENFYLSDERFNSSNQPYIFDQGKIVVENNIFAIRGIFDHYQISNNIVPLNFVSGAKFENNEISIISGLSQKYNLFIQPGLILEFPFHSPGIEVDNVLSVIRISDGVFMSDVCYL
jgi:hypothetical protein